LRTPSSNPWSAARISTPTAPPPQKPSPTPLAALDRERIRTADLTAADHATLEKLANERDQLRSRLAQSPTGDTSLANYDRIAHAKGTAVAEALNQQCTACRMMLRPQRWNDLRDNSPDSPSADTIFSCENCGRMIFYSPARDAPQRQIPAVGIRTRREARLGIHRLLHRQLSLALLRGTFLSRTRTLKRHFRLTK